MQSRKGQGANTVKVVLMLVGFVVGPGYGLAQDHAELDLEVFIIFFLVTRRLPPPPL